MKDYLVILAPDEAIPQHLGRAEKIAKMAEHMEKVLQEIQPVIEEFSGQIVHIQAPLAVITIQADESLIDKLKEMDVVTAIMGDQPVYLPKLQMEA